MISAIIPAFNEESTIGETVRALKAVGCADEIIVVDDGSADRTAAEANKAGAKVVHLTKNRGKRAALDAGIRASRGALLLLIDADLGSTASQVPLLLQPVESGDADMAIAMFPVNPGAGGGFGFVVRLARWGIRRASGRDMAAPLSGQRALRRAVWDRTRGSAPGFGTEVALTIDALCLGYHIVEVPTEMSHRVTGRDLAGITHRLRQFIAVARALWLRRSKRCPAPPSRHR